MGEHEGLRKFHAEIIPRMGTFWIDHEHDERTSINDYAITILQQLFNFATDDRYTWADGPWMEDRHVVLGWMIGDMHGVLIFDERDGRLTSHS